MIKSELRKIYLTKQKGLSPAERAHASERITNSFFDSFDLNGINYLHAFIPIEKFNEVDTKLIFQKVWREFPRIQTVVPRVDFESNEIRNLRFGPDTEVSRNVWDIDEPTHDELVGTETIDMVLVPGLCFDGQGHRVGYGKGFYDRFLKRCRPDAVTIGLSHFELAESIDDVHDGDIRLDFVITPDGMRNAERGVRNR